MNLSANAITDAGAGELARALPRSLRVLNLADNAIGDGGARDLAAALGGLDALEKLYLTNNSVGAEGARLLATLGCSVDLHRNPGAEGAPTRETFGPADRPVVTAAVGEGSGFLSGKGFPQSEIGLVTGFLAGKGGEGVLRSSVEKCPQDGAQGIFHVFFSRRVSGESAAYR